MRSTTPVFGTNEAAEIAALIEEGRRDEADDQLRHLVHLGVAPTVLFESAMALQRQNDGM